MIQRVFLASILALSLGAFAFALVRTNQEMEMAKPSPEHDQLQKSVGEWEGTLKMMMPGMPESAIPAQETVTSIGPFWTQSRFTCDMGGMPFLGVGLQGYDPEKKKYIGTWVDATSSYLAIMEGEMDAKANKLTMRWIAPDMMTGKPGPHRFEVTFTENTYTSTFFSGEGAGTKTMVIEMKRKAAAKGTAK